MTIDEAKKLSDEELRVMAAELCGFTPSTEEKYPHRRIWTRPPVKPSRVGWWGTLHDLPDYCNNETAIMAEERKLTDEQHNLFREHLRAVTRCSVADFNQRNRAYVSATARQRCEAFVVTLSK